MSISDDIWSIALTHVPMDKEMRELALPAEADFLRFLTHIEPTLKKAAYVVDCDSHKLAYASVKLAALLGTDPPTLLDNPDIIRQSVNETEIKRIATIHRSATKFLQTLPTDLYAALTLAYNVRINVGGASAIMRNEIMMFPQSKRNKINMSSLLFGTLSISTETASGEAMIIDCISGNHYILNLQRDIWEKMTLPSLSSTELCVLRLAAQGFSIEQTASHLPISRSTVRKYRQRIFEKLDVCNVTEAVTKAQLLGIL